MPKASTVTQHPWHACSLSPVRTQQCSHNHRASFIVRRLPQNKLTQNQHHNRTLPHEHQQSGIGGALLMSLIKPRPKALPHTVLCVSQGKWLMQHVICWRGTCGVTHTARATTARYIYRCTAHLGPPTLSQDKHHHNPHSLFTAMLSGFKSRVYPKRALHGSHKPGSCHGLLHTHTRQHGTLPHHQAPLTPSTEAAAGSLLAQPPPH